MRTTVLGVTVLTLLLAGCTSSDGSGFEVADLAEGACSQAGPALLEVDRTQRALTAGDLDPAGAGADYEQLQADLLTARDSADQAVGDALRSLVTSLGVFRLGVAAGTSNEVQQQQLQTSLDSTLRACGVAPATG